MKDLNFEPQTELGEGAGGEGVRTTTLRLPAVLQDIMKVKLHIERAGKGKNKYKH